MGTTTTTAEPTVRSYTATDLMKISENMVKYGGSFFASIGTALRVADIDNTIKILEAWPEEIERYSNYK
jgi:predicted P-loop ATPase/GTPase